MQMTDEVLDRGVPDVTPTADLSTVLAAEVDLLAGRWDRWVGSDVEPGLRARALVVAGHPLAARRALAEPGVAAQSLQSALAAVWAASRVGSPVDVQEVLEARVEADGADPTAFLAEQDVAFGPAALFQGLLRSRAGDLAEARVLLASAADVGDARSPAWGARARLEWARVLGTLVEITSDDCDGLREGDLRDERSRVVGSARMFFVAGGYHHLAQVANALLLTPPVTVRADPTLGHLVPGSRWSVGFGVQPAVEVRGSKGLIAIRHLIENRGRAVPAIELEAVVDGRADDARRIVDQLRGEVGSEVGELAARLHDDRARSSVSKLLHRTIDGLGAHHATLAAHLHRAIQPGHLSRYVAGDQVVWRLDLRSDDPVDPDT